MDSPGLNGRYNWGIVCITLKDDVIFAKNMTGGSKLIENNIRPKIDPWGTPPETGAKEEDALSILIEKSCI